MPQILLIAALTAAVIAALSVTVKRLRKGSACCGDIAQKEQRTQSADRDPKHYPYTVTLRIRGMTCENCARRVENALHAEEGILAKVDLSRGTATVRMKTERAPRELCSIVARAGYVAEEM